AGAYWSTNRAPGGPAILAIPPAGWRVTSAQTGPVQIGGAVGVRLDFGLSDRARVSGVVFIDANANGARDPGEAANPNLAREVYLDLDNEGFFDTGEPLPEPAT